MLGVPGRLVHPGLRARNRESVDSCNPDYFHPFQHLDMPRTVKSSERVDETDAANDSISLVVDTGGCSFGDSVASPENGGGGGDCARPRGLLSSWRVSNVASKEPRGAKQTRNKGCDRTFFSCYSRGRKWHPNQNSHFRRLGDPRQTGPAVDGSALASPVGRPGHVRLTPMDENEIVRKLKTIFVEEQLGVVA